MNIQDIELRVRNRDRKKEEEYYFPVDFPVAEVAIMTKFFLCCRISSGRKTPKSHFPSLMKDIDHIFKNPTDFEDLFSKWNVAYDYFGCFASHGPANGSICNMVNNLSDEYNYEHLPFATLVMHIKACYRAIDTIVIGMVNPLHFVADHLHLVILIFVPKMDMLSNFFFILARIFI